MAAAGHQQEIQRFGSGTVSAFLTKRDDSRSFRTVAANRGNHYNR